MRVRGLGVLALVLLAGCIPAAQLQPQPEARTLAGESSAAVAEAAGVRLVADGTSWSGRPSNLERRLTPVEIRLENQSGRPLSVRYTLFELVGASRFHYAAIPPLKLDEVDTSRACIAEYSPGYWGQSRPWGWRRGWRGPWHRPWWPDPYYDPFYDPYYPRPIVRCEDPLPTRDMVERALPEGTLQPGGTVTGFLYFQGVAERERQVTLHARLVDASTGEPFGELSIPFQVSR
jgi:hypothetical protein